MTEGCESYWWDLTGQVDILGYRLLPTQRACLIQILHLLTTVHRLGEYFDQAVFHRNIDVGTLLNFLSEIALGLDRQFLATAEGISR